MDYDREALEKMVENIDLLDYASHSFDFKPRGRDSYATHCPLHVDLTESLFITPSKNLFHCFSCGVGGSVLQWMTQIEKLPFKTAINKISELTGTDVSCLQKCSALIFYKEIKRNHEEQNKSPIERTILPENAMDQFADEVPEEWLSEGISADVMKKYNIRIDKRGNRIVYPVYDANYNLIGFKGRTRFKNYKDMRIAKYMNYVPVGKVDYFVGMKENRSEIINGKSVFIFEGIKSGMKVESWGYKNWLASETSWLNSDQVRLLIKLGVKDVIIAYDNDVPIKKIRECTEMLRRFVNVYVIEDKNRLLGSPEDKMSPCDRGREIWEQLYKERIKL